MKIIVTGFEPFGNYKFNPTQDLARYYHGQKFGKDIEIIGLVLPATYDAFAILHEAMEKEKPNAIISTGLSSRAQGIRIETAFKNKMESKYADANGVKPKGLPVADPTKSGARPFWGPHADCLFLAEELYKAKIPVEISGNADTFICNALGYRTTRRIWLDSHPIKNVFVHIPWTDDYKEKVPLTRGKMFLETKKVHLAIEIIMETILMDPMY